VAVLTLDVAADAAVNPDVVQLSGFYLFSAAVAAAASANLVFLALQFQSNVKTQGFCQPPAGCNAIA